MDTNKLQKQLEIDEGVKYEIYLDHMGYPTFGIGHLILKTDPEYGMPVGTKVSPERVREAFIEDVDNVLNDCETLHNDFISFPGEVQQIIANMMFNMGLTRMMKFKKMNAAVREGRWKDAAAEMRSSAWYKQVPNRAERLAKRMETV